MLLATSQRLVFRSAQGSDAVDRILGAVRSTGLRVTGVTTRQPDLEEVFLGLVRREAAPGS